MLSVVQAGRKMVFLNLFLAGYKLSQKIFTVYFLLKFMAIKWLNRAEITLGLGPKNYVFLCASRKENGLLNSFFYRCNAIDFSREQVVPSNIFAVYFLLKLMAIKWLNRAEITWGFGPKNYVFRCASRKENGIFELVFCISVMQLTLAGNTRSHQIYLQCISCSNLWLIMIE